MVLRTMRFMALGAAMGIGAYRVYLELQKPAAEQFPWLRRQANERVNPWLLEHGIPGSAKAEIGTLEHVGRRSGVTYFTPVHPTIRDETVLIPAPLGVGSQWARNVLHAGRARLQLHETLYDLDRAEMIPVADTGFYPAQVAAPFDRMGLRYLRFHVAAAVPGTFATHASSLPAGASPEWPLGETFEIPIEPLMVEREGAPA
jgi:hypothetical protein